VKAAPSNAGLEFEEARRIILEAIRSLSPDRQAESVALEQAHGRVLAEPVLADRDYPTLRRSLRDGFGVKSDNVPAILRVRGEIRAGQSEQAPLEDGEALEIMTGAPLPEGANAVVMVEHVVRLPEESGTERVKIDRTVEPGQFINERGAEAKSGTLLIPSGTQIDASHVAALAMTGHVSVRVVPRPSVAVLATGDEVVDLHSTPAAHQVRNSNSYMLASLVLASGGDPVVLPIAQDTPEALHPLLARGLKHDMLLITGGVSAGKYDLVKPVLRELGAEFQFERVRIQPGQPTAFGIAQNTPVFGLPGNPGSTLVTFQLFARLALNLLSKRRDPILPLLWTRLEAPFQHKGGLTRFLPAWLTRDGQHIRHIPWQGSSDVPALAKANAFLVADHDRQQWDGGDLIRVMLKS